MALVSALADSPSSIFQALAETILEGARLGHWLRLRARPFVHTFFYNKGHRYGDGLAYQSFTH